MASGKRKVGVEIQKIRACKTRLDAIFQLGSSLARIGGIEGNPKGAARLQAAYDRDWGKKVVARRK